MKLWLPTVLLLAPALSLAQTAPAAPSAAPTTPVLRAEMSDPTPPPAVQQPPTPAPSDIIPPAPQNPAPPAEQPAAGTPSQAGGQWVYTNQYGWVWMPYGNAYTYVPPSGDAPDMYVYYPSVGWTWVVAPWIWGWGPQPYFGLYGTGGFGWYGVGYGRWYGYAGPYAGWYGRGYYAGGRWVGGGYHPAGPRGGGFAGPGGFNRGGFSAPRGGGMSVGGHGGGGHR